jgi:hypothetical protein
MFNFVTIKIYFLIEILNTLLRLAHAGDGAEWVELPQKLMVPRFWHVAILVPDFYANCTFN